jgi:hypothetical protein
MAVGMAKEYNKKDRPNDWRLSDDDIECLMIKIFIGLTARPIHKMLLVEVLHCNVPVLAAVCQKIASPNLV